MRLGKNGGTLYYLAPGQFQCIILSESISLPFPPPLIVLQSHYLNLAFPRKMLNFNFKITWLSYQNSFQIFYRKELCTLHWVITYMFGWMLHWDITSYLQTKVQNNQHVQNTKYSKTSTFCWISNSLEWKWVCPAIASPYSKLYILNKHCITSL